MSTVKLPGLAACLSIHIVRILIFAIAWFCVPIGFLVGGIRKGDKILGQWNGAYADEHDIIIYGYKVEAIETSSLFKIFDLPDEPGITLYEPTVAKIYRRFGWYGAVYYNLAFRNVGHGWFSMFRQELGEVQPNPDDLLVSTLGILHGLKPYEDWRSYNGVQNPNPRKFYGIPALGKS